jgi:2-dehydro-3-deoxyphosphooctonate aldolase (KDO 8-P synthase)
MGIGDEKALKILKKVNETFGVPTVTDIHSAEEAAMAAEYADVLQIPAFLCRQTDLLIAAAKTGKIVNIKKGQFLSPGAMQFAANKVVEAGNNNVMITERGTTFGYQDLIVDYRGIPEMQKFGFPVIVKMVTERKAFIDDSTTRNVKDIQNSKPVLGINKSIHCFNYM